MSRYPRIDHFPRWTARVEPSRRSPTTAPSTFVIRTDRRASSTGAGGLEARLAGGFAALGLEPLPLGQGLAQLAGHEAGVVVVPGGQQGAAGRGGVGPLASG